MNAVPRFDIVETAGAAGQQFEFARAVARRVTWKKVTATIAIVLAMLEIHELSWHADMPMSLRLPGLADTVITSSCGFSILIAVLAADEAVARGARRLHAYLFAVAAGAIAGAMLQEVLRAIFHIDVWLCEKGYLVCLTVPFTIAFDAMMQGGLVTFVYVNLRTARLAAQRRREAEVARSETRRKTFESQLQAMQARVEPQFLFNTLAQVRQLYETNATLAGTMLDDLIAYLRAALPHLRESSSTLGKEVELARAYLNIVRIRLGERLAFDIDVPDAIANARMPPMMLLPLVDHALVYGLGPSHEGGTVRIATHAEGGKLHLSITDSGVGFVPGGDAADLKTIEQRLYALYGADASLKLERMHDGTTHAGTRAMLDIPYESTDRADR